MCAWNFPKPRKPCSNPGRHTRFLQKRLKKIFLPGILETSYVIIEINLITDQTKLNVSMPYFIRMLFKQRPVYR